MTKEITPIKLREQPKVEIIASVNDLMGEMARYAVLQSPYSIPEGLEQGLDEFENALKKMLDGWKCCLKFYYFDGRWELEDFVFKAIEKCPTIVAWNEPRKGKEQLFRGVSIHDGERDPDYDFVDLHALAGNIANVLYWKALDDMVDQEAGETEIKE